MNATEDTKNLINLFLVEFNRWVTGSYSVTHWPDEQVRDQKAVDAIARDKAGRELAIEHTLLQPFVGERADAVAFMQVAGRLDQRVDLAEPNWMIDLVFDIGAIPRGVNWTSVADRLEKWFVSIRPTLPAGGSVHEIDQVPFSFRVTVRKSALPNSSGKIFVARGMPEESVEGVLRSALAAKVAKLAATSADGHILLLEMDSPIRGEWEIGEAVESVRADYPGLQTMSSIWIARTVSWRRDGFVTFYLIWPLDMAIEHQHWHKGEA